MLLLTRSKAASLSWTASNRTVLSTWWRGSKIGKLIEQKKPKSTLLADNTRVANNKTNKAQASRFFNTASHHSSRHKIVWNKTTMPKINFRRGGGERERWYYTKYISNPTNLRVKLVKTQANRHNNKESDDNKGHCQFGSLSWEAQSNLKRISKRQI